jgi:hypothetical protein
MLSNFEKIRLNHLENIRFNHLDIRKISYFDHLFVALGYAKESILAAFYFTVHGLYPDWYVISGSTTISELHLKIQNDNKIE